MGCANCAELVAGIEAKEKSWGAQYVLLVQEKAALTERVQEFTLQLRKLKHVIDEVAKYSQLCLDKPMFRLPEHICDLIRSADEPTRQAYVDVPLTDENLVGIANSINAQAAQAAAEEYVRETDYIDNRNRRLAGQAFLAGVNWAHEQTLQPGPEETTQVRAGSHSPQCKNRGVRGYECADDCAAVTSNGEKV